MCQLRNTLPKELVIASAKVRVLDAVASGSFGQVCRAEYNGNIVAVKRYKVCRPYSSPCTLTHQHGHFLSKSKVDLFCREVTLLSLVSHPNVLRLIVRASTLSPLSLMAAGGVRRGAQLVRHCDGSGRRAAHPIPSAAEFLSGGNLYGVLHVHKRVRVCISPAADLTAADAGPGDQGAADARRGARHAAPALAAAAHHPPRSHQVAPPRHRIHPITAAQPQHHALRAGARRDCRLWRVRLPQAQPYLCRFAHHAARRACAAPARCNKRVQNLRWMAPEVFVQNTLYSEKADVFRCHWSRCGTS